MDYNYSKLLRIYSGYSQEDFASLIGIVRSSLSKYEQGRTPVPFKAMQKVAKACNISIESLFLAVTDVPKELNKEEKALYQTLRLIMRMRLISKAEKKRLASTLTKVA
jgi:transcriptional regulator with XRE-family HTH domain